MSSNDALIQELIAKLKASTDDKEKRKIRSRLRSLGHRGGTGEPRTPAQGTSSGRTQTKREAMLTFRKPLELELLTSTPPKKLSDAQLIEALRHPDMDRKSPLFQTILTEWNIRAHMKTSKIEGKPSEYLDRRAARELRIADDRMKLATAAEPKRKGKRANPRDLKPGTITRPIDMGRSCPKCSTSMFLVWGGKQDNVKDTICPKCHPELIGKYWPVKEAERKRDELKKKGLNLGYAPDWGWYVYRRAKSPNHGFERVGEFTRNIKELR